MVDGGHAAIGIALLRIGSAARLEKDKIQPSKYPNLTPCAQNLTVRTTFYSLLVYLPLPLPLPPRFSLLTPNPRHRRETERYFSFPTFVPSEPGVSLALYYPFPDSQVMRPHEGPGLCFLRRPPGSVLVNRYSTRNRDGEKKPQATIISSHLIQTVPTFPPPLTTPPPIIPIHIP